MSEKKEMELPNLEPDAKISYPLKVQYCGNCTMPIEVFIIIIFLLF